MARFGNLRETFQAPPPKHRTRPTDVPCAKCAVGVPLQVAIHTHGYCAACAEQMAVTK